MEIWNTWQPMENWRMRIWVNMQSMNICQSLGSPKKDAQKCLKPVRNEAIELKRIFYLYDQKYCSHWTTIYQAGYTKQNTIDYIHSIRGPNGGMK